jgi:amino acid transporter
LRNAVPHHDRPYRLPSAHILGPLAFVVASMVIYWSGFEVVWKLGICLVVGYVLIGTFMAFDSERPPLDWRPAQWLPVYLLGMGIISWQGQYSGGAVKSPTNTNFIPFGWDMVVVAVFALIIFYWASAVALPSHEVEELVNRQAEEKMEPPV